MHIVISNTSDLPIYVQIKEQVKEQILSGELEEDEMLPSLRQLAKDLKISVLTTTRAYNELEEEGFITSRQGKGSTTITTVFISDIRLSFSLVSSKVFLNANILSNLNF